MRPRAGAAAVRRSKPATRNCARRRRQQAAQHAERRGLAGPVGAEQAENLAAGDGEAHVVDGDEGAEAAGEMLAP